MGLTLQETLGALQASATDPQHTPTITHGKKTRTLNTSFDPSLLEAKSLESVFEADEELHDEKQLQRDIYQAADKDTPEELKTHIESWRGLCHYFGSYYRKVQKALSQVSLYYGTSRIKSYANQTTTPLWTHVAFIAYLIFKKAYEQTKYARTLKSSDNSLSSRTDIINQLKYIPKMLFRAYDLCLALSEPQNLESNVKACIQTILTQNRDLLRLERKSLNNNPHTGSFRGTSTVHELALLGYKLDKTLPRLDFLTEFQANVAQPLFGEHKNDRGDDKPVFSKNLAGSNSPQALQLYIQQYVERIITLCPDEREFEIQLKLLCDKIPPKESRTDDRYDFASNATMSLILSLVNPQQFAIILNSPKIRQKLLNGASKGDDHLLSVSAYQDLLTIVSKQPTEKQTDFLAIIKAHFEQYPHTFSSKEYKTPLNFLYLYYDFPHTFTQNVWLAEVDQWYPLGQKNTPPSLLKSLKRDYRFRPWPDNMIPTEPKTKECYLLVRDITQDIQLKARGNRDKIASPQDRRALRLLALRIWDLYNLAVNEDILQRKWGLYFLLKKVAKELNTCRVLLRKKRKPPTEHNKADSSDSFNTCESICDNTLDHILRLLPETLHYDLKLPIPTGDQTQVSHDGTRTNFECLTTAQDTRIKSFEADFTAGHPAYDAAKIEFAKVNTVDSTTFLQEQLAEIATHAAAKARALASRSRDARAFTKREKEIELLDLRQLNS